AMELPRARRESVTKTVGGVTFEDPYAWLQDDTPEALAWQWEQDAAAERSIRAWPGFDRLNAAIAAAGSASSPFTRSAPRLNGGRWFLFASRETHIATGWPSD